MTTITYDLLYELADAVEGRTYSNYGGRGMYGQLCAGIVIESDGDLLGLGAAIAELVEDSDLKATLLNGSRLDSMGLGTIVYWPTVSCPDGQDEDDD